MKFNKIKLIKVLHEIETDSKAWPYLAQKNLSKACDWTIDQHSRTSNNLARLHLALIDAQAAVDDLLTDSCKVKGEAAISAVWHRLWYLIVWIRDIVGRYIIHTYKL